MKLVRKPEGKRPLGRSKRWWVDNIRIDLGDIEWCGVDWIGLAQDRDIWGTLVKAVMNLWGSMNRPEALPQLHNWWSLE
jgi:hypothetical protein